MMHGIPVCVFLTVSAVIGGAFALPRNRNLLISPFKEQYFSTLGDVVLTPMVDLPEEANATNQESNSIASKFIYQQVMAAVRDAVREREREGLPVEQALPIFPKPAKRRQRYQQHFDVLAGGGLGR
ncbi:unnamed protein product [Bursaphelenchus xylophilus]|uniref:(pine wood nematode) hypothetical protein n=1 Tax=Bursaphelenchus xylophilus TaxID=6326 RepID=A0A1I7SS32_BURXY|nr:unnamed protein product [Bursaphelenchus xylophilus]CAG9105737.1 unnamed protein product [Bursaphelenchus xylophilus]